MIAAPPAIRPPRAPAPGRAIRSASPARREPALEVITSQGAILTRLWQRVGPEPAGLQEIDAPVSGTTPDSAAGEIALRPVTINPIVVGALGGQSAPSGEIIRRDVAGRQ